VGNPSSQWSLPHLWVHQALCLSSPSANNFKKENVTKQVVKSWLYLLLIHCISVVPFWHPQ
jgi:hypothetical protein